MVKICTQIYDKSNEAFDSWDFTLSDFQKYAIESIISGHNTIITAHTGSGKTLPAEFLMRYFKDKNKKVIYTAPIKALSNEKYWDLQKKFPEISFGLITGDTKFNPDADVLIMTTECLCNTLYQMRMIKTGNLKSEQVNLLFEMDIENELGGVVFDEIHYVNDPDRGHVWEESIMMLPNNIQILGLSATMNNPEKFCSWIENKGKEVWLCPNDKRVVPLKHYSFITIAESVLDKFPKKIKNLIDEKKITIKEEKFDDLKYEKISKLVKYFRQNNVYIDKKFVLNRFVNYLKIKNLLPGICFVFSQKKCEEFASIISKNLFEEGSKIPSLIKDECKKIMMKLPNYREYIELPEYKKIIRLLEKGIAYHHAGVTSVFREMIELLFSKGYIKFLFATETFSVGINMPTRTVAFTSMKKFSNKGFRWLKSHEYSQMSGRAGRRGKDTVGHVFHLTNFYAIQQDNYPCTQTMREIFSGNSPLIESKFKINSSIILKLISVDNNDFNDFIKNSMISDSIDKQNKIYIEISNSLVEKKERMSKSLSLLQTNIEDMVSYKELESQVKHLSRKKRKQVLRNMENIKEKTKSFISDYDLYLSFENLNIEIIKQQKKQKNLEQYVQNEINMILEMLLEYNFIIVKNETDKISYELTEKGQIASNINELHPLAIATVIDSKLLNNLTPCEIACVLSIFTNLKLSDNNSVLNKNTLYISKNAISAIEKIENAHKLFYDYQLIRKMDDLQHTYLENIHYNMCDFIQSWWNCSDANQCYKEVEKMKYFNVSLGKIIKGILKLNNIVDELDKICLIQNNFELMEKLREIPKNTLKFIATNQSLYL